MILLLVNIRLTGIGNDKFNKIKCAVLTLELDPHLLRFLEGHVDKASSIRWLTYNAVTLLLCILVQGFFLLLAAL